MILDLNNKYRIKILLDILKSNTLFIKSIILMILFEYSDISFISNINSVIIRGKCKTGSIVLGAINEIVFQQFKFQLKLGIGCDVFNNISTSYAIKIEINKKLYLVRCSIHESNNNLYQTSSISLRLIRTINMYAQYNNIIDYIINSAGLTIIGGVTCSGKTTFMYSVLHQFYLQKSAFIYTMEDPIESHLEFGLQTNISTGEYISTLKSILRHNPDVIVVGEIRDYEAANAVVHASLTGHKVIATIHMQTLNDLFIKYNEYKLNYLHLILKNVVIMNNYVPELISNVKAELEI